ncbi:MAG TPA: DUF481 domain-containing protein [Puia sp.]|nr:DUF481 domain-containing protein [Puia sp.]
MKRITGLIVGLIVLLPLLATGQTMDPGDMSRDSASARQPGSDSIHHTDTPHFHYNYTGTGSLDKTNSLRSYLVSQLLKLSLLKKSSTINFTNNWVYGKQNSAVTNNDLTSSLDIGIYKTLKHFFYWGMANYTTSVSLLIHQQEQTGLGPGYNIIDKKKATLLISDGVIYEHGDLYDSLYGGSNGNSYQRDIYHVFRNSFHLLFRWVIKDRYTLDGSGFLQNALSNWNDYKLQLYGSGSIKLEKWLALTGTLVYDRFTRTRSRNTLVTFGATIQR